MEKVYCCGDRDNDNVLAAAILANKPNYDPMAFASMLGNNRNGGGFGNNFPELFKDTKTCVIYANRIVDAENAYEGIIFCRWISDIIGNNIKINWEKFI